MVIGHSRAVINKNRTKAISNHQATIRTQQEHSRLIKDALYGSINTRLKKDFRACFFLALKANNNSFVFIVFTLVAYSFLVSTSQDRRKYLSCHQKSFLRCKLRKNDFGNMLLLWGNCSCETQRLHLAGSGSQPEPRIWFVLPAHEASHISSGIN